MRKIIAFMHISLDGFAAGPNGEMDWITMDDEIFQDATDLAAPTDAAIYGRVTYQGMESYWPAMLNNPDATPLELHHANWVRDIRKIVISKSLEKADWNNTQLIRDNVQEQISQLKQQPGKDMLIFGSPTITHLLMGLGLVDQYRINVNPMLLGAGVPMFENLKHGQRLKLLSQKTFSSGVVGLLYENN